MFLRIEASDTHEKKSEIIVEKYLVFALRYFKQMSNYYISHKTGGTLY